MNWKVESIYIIMLSNKIGAYRLKNGELVSLRVEWARERLGWFK